MWGGSLEFQFHDGNLHATNGEKTLELTEAFDFEDYKDATGTRPFPPMFQKLVQDSISYNIQPPPCIPCCDSFFLFFPHEIVQIILSFVLGELYSIKAMKHELLPHQILALEYALPKPASLLALDMGLGKTCVSFAYILAKQCKKALIVCPAALKLNWKSEAMKFLDIKLIDLETTKKVPFLLEKHKNKHLFVISYSLLKYVEKELLNESWDALLFDEAHALKNNKSARAKTAFNLRKKVNQNIVLLTGTPAASAAHLWNLLRFLEPTVFAQFFHYKKAGVHYKPSSDIFYFAERYTFPECVYASGGRTTWAFRKSMRMTELHALTRQYILRQKKDDFLDLPPFIREHVVVGESSTQQKKQFEITMQKANELAEKKGQVFAQSLLMEQIRETSRQKLPCVLKYITQLAEGEDKFIIWAHHKFVIEAIHEHLDALKIKHIVVNGETPKSQRPHMYKALEEDDDTRIAVLSLEACGTGLNLAFIQLTVYAELTFNFVSSVQSEGRCHRIGQTGAKVTAQYLIYKDSTDDMIFKSIIQKTNNESLVLDNKRADFLYDRLFSLQDQNTLLEETPKRKNEEGEFGGSTKKLKTE